MEPNKSPWLMSDTMVKKFVIGHAIKDGPCARYPIVALMQSSINSEKKNKLRQTINQLKMLAISSKHLELIWQIMFVSIFLIFFFAKTKMICQHVNKRWHEVFLCFEVIIWWTCRIAREKESNDPSCSVDGAWPVIPSYKK